MSVPGGRLVEPRVKVPPPPGEEAAGPAISGLVEELHATAAELRHAYTSLRREWSQYREIAAGVTSSAAASINTPQAPSGFETEVERITISCGGVSAAATVAVYRGGANEGVLVDFAGAMLGNSPSRLLLKELPVIRLLGGEFLTVVLASTAAGTNQVYVRLEGRKRSV